MSDLRGDYLAYHNDARACTACTCRAEAKNPVPGIGTVPNDILVVGRNPGGKEDKIGLPFVGPSGQMVDDWLWAANLSRNNVFITNIVLCYTTDNRQPNKKEVEACTKAWLLKTLAFVQPKLVLPMGRLAADVFGVPGSILNASGRVYNHGKGFVVIPCVHPGGVLRKPDLRTILDFTCEVVKKYAEEHELDSRR